VSIIALSKGVKLANAGMLMTAKHILVIDDDPGIRNLITEYLSGYDFHVSTGVDGQAMARILAESSVDLIVLDLKLAREDGLELARELRAKSNIPIIILTGQRRDEVDRVLGLELGADDYLTKPFSPRELLARIRAVLRRTAPVWVPTQEDKQKSYRFAGWELNVGTHCLTSRAGKPVPLTKGELNLLMAFLHSPQQVLSRDQLLNSIYMHDSDVYDRSIDVQILRLRRKLEVDPNEPQLIKTERGIGYIFTATVETFCKVMADG
jgi:DNA-binding response OmpR family regulator